MKRLLTGIVLTLAAILAGPSHDSTLQAQGQGLAVGRPEWAAAVRHDTSRPLREVPPLPMVNTRADFEVKQAPPSAQAGQADQSIQSIVVAPLSATNTS